MTPAFDPQAHFPVDIRNKFYIGGGWCPPSSHSVSDLITPSTEEVVGEVPQAAVADIDAAVAAARHAFDTGPWPRLAPLERAALVTRLGDAIRNRIADFAQMWTGLVGAPVSFAGQAIQAPLRYFDYYAQLAGEFQFAESRKTPGGEVIVRQQPVGVCALITPWNAPLTILANKLPAALVAGCTVVIKPSPETPLEALFVAHLAHDLGFPPGVINVVLGGRDAGEMLVAHRGIDKVSFTGGTNAGVAIAKQCANRMARVSLELGGKSAAIVLDDADLATMLSVVVPFSMPLSGQACLAQTRILVPRNRADEISTAFVGAINGLNLGDPWDPATHLGPVISGAQMHRILGHIDVAKEQGATTLTGGGRAERFNRGYFVEPTVFADVRRDMSIAKEEIFGPVVSIIPYDDEEEAVSIANDTDFGLHGTVFSHDLRRAEHVAHRIRTGSIGLNCFNLDASAPFGGFKLSGVNREGGPEGLRPFLESQSVYYPG